MVPEIDSLAVRYVEAVLAKDESRFMSLYDEDVVVFDLWDRWSYVGREAWSQSVAAWFGSLGEERVAVSFEPLSCIVEGNWAIWCAITTYSAVTTAGQVMRSMQNRISWSLRRRDGEWFIVHEHSSAPIDPETMRVKLTC